MPTRRRTAKAGVSRTQELRALQTCVESEVWNTFGSYEAAEEAYRRRRDELRFRPGRRSAAFWRFDPDVPDHLRGQEAFRPASSLDDAIRRHGELREARAAWLREQDMT